MKYRPDRYVNRIAIVKAVPRPNGFLTSQDVYFDTWQEARAWLIADRAAKVEQADKALKAALRALDKAERIGPEPRAIS